MLVISLLSFSIQDELGDPLRELVGQSVSEETREELREEMGLNDPFLAQYMRFLRGALRGDLGVSYFFKRPALDVILDKLPATIDLVLAATFWILLFSVPVGVFAAVNPRHWFSNLAMGTQRGRHFGAGVFNRDFFDLPVLGGTRLGCRPTGAAKQRKFSAGKPAC